MHPRHQIIAYYLDFIEAEAQVIIDNLSPSLFFYLPNLFNFLISKANEPRDQPPNLTFSVS